MQRCRFREVHITLFTAVVLFYVLLFQLSAVEEKGEEHPWNMSVSLGVVGYEGDEEVENDFITSLHLGYDYSEWWTFEGILSVAPELNEDFRFDIPTQTRVSRLEETAGPGVHDTYSIGLAVDSLFHFTRWERFDPYLSVGGGVVWYADDFGNEFDPSVRVGGGVMYHFNDEWAVRADGRTFVAGTDTEANMILSAGVTWTPGAGIPPSHKVAGGPIDSDAGDLKLYELRVRFETDKWDINPEYFPELNIIGKVLQQDPGATARIEGHVDKQKESSARHSKRLSQKRAKAILTYLADNLNIDRSRMKAVGYGFSRPKAPNDPVSGNPENRRIEIYIRLSDDVSRAWEIGK